MNKQLGQRICWIAAYSWFLLAVGVALAQLPMKRQSVGSKHVAVQEAGSGYVVIYPATGKGESSFTVDKTSFAWDPELNGYGGPLTNTVSGTCTNISFKGSSGAGTTTFKVALYNSSSNLVANGTVESASTSAAWLDVAVSATVSNDTYRVMIFSSASTGELWYDTDSGYYALDDPTDYGDAPPSVLTPSHFDNFVFGVRMHVTY